MERAGLEDTGTVRYEIKYEGYMNYMYCVYIYTIHVILPANDRLHFLPIYYYINPF